MKYKLIIFDFDGTLADSFPWVTSIMNQLAAEFKMKPIGKDEIEMLRNLDAAKIIRQFGLPWWKVVLMARRTRQLLRSNTHRVSLFEGVDTMLRSLSSQGATLAMVTSNAYENVQQILGPELASLFQYYECNVSLFGKSSRLRRVARQSGIPVGETLFIADELRDSTAAEKIAMPFGAVAWGYTRIKALKENTYSEAFDQVDDILNQLM